MANTSQGSVATSLGCGRI